jgi:hypothetical protein
LKGSRATGGIQMGVQAVIGAYKLLGKIGEGG